MSKTGQGRHGLVTIALLMYLAAPAVSYALSNCAGGGKPRPDEGGVGGTGNHPAGNEGGIGGTGVHPGGIGGTGLYPDGIGGTGVHPGGIGGTGISADTGIIGTITGFGSICVGGLEVLYDATTPIEFDGHAAGASELGVGQVVEVVAGGSGDEVRARSIVLRHAVSGPIERIDAERNQIQVLGQTVQLSPTTRVEDRGAPLPATALAAQAFVRISGLRRADGTIVASRIVNSTASDVVGLNGRVSDAGGVLKVAGVVVHADTPQSLRAGDEVQIAGRWDGTSITVDAIETAPKLPFSGRVGIVDIEGYVHGSAETGQMFIGAYQIEVPKTAVAATTDLNRPESYVRLRAVLRDQHIVAERISVVGDLPPLPPIPDHGAGTGRGVPDDHGDGHPNWGPSDQQHGDGGHGPAAAPPPSRPDAGGDALNPPELDHGSHPAHPDRPSMPDMPNPPDRPSLPDRPPRPERPNTDRPPHMDMPGMHHGH
ncbi:MAG: hypothetical protein HY270_15990 [Deltaproteobacteria bacterium]|nr:hypothetical protein [Deltaproteobacteria bacterium]